MFYIRKPPNSLRTQELINKKTFLVSDFCFLNLMWKLHKNSNRKCLASLVIPYDTQSWSLTLLKVVLKQKLRWIFIFTLLLRCLKRFYKAFIKPFEAPQRSVEIVLNCAKFFFKKRKYKWNIVLLFGRYGNNSNIVEIFNYSVHSGFNA